MAVTPIATPAPRATLSQCIAAIPDGAKQQDHVRALVRELYRLGAAFRVDPLVLVAQSRHETGGWTSPEWEQRLNPAGMKTADGAKYQAFLNGVDAARAQFVHMAAYLGGELPAKVAIYDRLDQRLGAVHSSGYAGTVRNVEDLGNGRWATDPNYAAGILKHMRAIAPDWKQMEEPVTPPRQGEQLTIVIAAGHRDTKTGGSEDERRRTPGLARAYKAELQALGHRVIWVQESDGDSDPDDTIGSLDTVGRVTRELVTKHHADLMLDLHYEGGGGGEGVFVIVPDTRGLGTAVPDGAPPYDTWDNNSGDRELAAAIAKNISLATGLALRRTTLPGVMSETATGVAGAYHARLAMFAYTAVAAPYCIRLVIEHGNLSRPHDRAIADMPGFQVTAAKAAARAINSYDFDYE